MLDPLNRRPGTAMKRRANGLTLMELMVTVAILAILVALAMPSFNTFVARGRLSGAAEALAQDLQLAKSEALRRNADVTISFSDGAAWCYGSVVAAAACNCNVANSCALRRVDNTDYAGVTMAAPTFAGNATTFTARPGPVVAGQVELTHPNAGTLRVSLGATGQVRVCSTTGGLGHLPAC
jgi:prepilin-type N-terminal cleavage/methylation domain-containing protein